MTAVHIATYAVYRATYYKDIHIPIQQLMALRDFHLSFIARFLTRLFLLCKNHCLQNISISVLLTTLITYDAIAPQTLCTRAHNVHGLIHTLEC